MFMDWESIGIGLGVLASVFGIVRGLWVAIPKLCKRLQNMFGIGDLKTDMAALHNQLQYVVDELKPNGGASIRDSLNRIEIRQVLQDQRQKAILSDMTVGVFETDTSGQYTWINRKYLRMSGRTPAEVKGTGWVNTVADRDRDRVIHEWHAAITEQREFETEYLMITPDNNRMSVQVRTYKMVDQDGHSLGFMGMVTPTADMASN